MLTVILTGGGSRRMGRDKAQLPFEGTSMSGALIKRYGKSLGDVAVSVDRAGRFMCDGATELVDSFPGKGPLNGLYSAFSSTGAELVFLTATDLPYGDPELAKLLADRIGGHDASVIQRSSGHLEPVFAVYRRSCLEAVKSCIEEGIFAFTRFFERIDVRLVPESELTGWELDRVLYNVNTITQYQEICDGGDC